MRDYIFKLSPVLPRKCPFNVGKYYGFNHSLPDGSIVDMDQPKFISPTLMPNGVYKELYKFYTDNDREGFCVRSHLEIYDVDNAENIMR